MEAYLDNCATTRVFDKVREAVDYAMLENYGNPSSKHMKGVQAEKLIREAREIIAGTLKVKDKEIVFTSGGTESNNMALIGTALAAKRRGKHIITTVMEHASIHKPLEFLEEMGYEVTYLPVDGYGHISPEELDMAALSAAVKAKNPNTVFHADAIQAYGKYVIRPKKEGIDLLSVSGHKIHGPKGTGFLYISEKVRLHPIIFGGGQQKDMRSGTENVPGCYGLGIAAKEIYTDHEDRIGHLYALRERLIAGLHELEGVTINGYEDRRNAPQIVSASFAGVRAEVLLHALEEESVYVSSGSACSSNHPGISGTLAAIGVKKDLLDSTIRLSFGAYTTEEQIDWTLEKLSEILPGLRRFWRH